MEGIENEVCQWAVKYMDQHVNQTYVTDFW